VNGPILESHELKIFHVVISLFTVTELRSNSSSMPPKMARLLGNAVSWSLPFDQPTLRSM
jgi:hypothetical protein